MTGAELARALADAMPRWAEAKDELTDLDLAIGDGDLGLTVAAGAEAVRLAVEVLDGGVDVSETLAAAARSFAGANPSTLSALAAAGLLAAVRELRSVADVQRPDAVRALRSAATVIGERGGAAPGDKTVLDALYPSIEALEDSEGPGSTALQAMCEAAMTGVEETTALVSRRGRAGWVGDRTAGHPDGGATAYWRLLEALIPSWDSPTIDPKEERV